MCGRYVALVSAEELGDVVDQAQRHLREWKGGDIRPSQAAPVITGRRQDFTVEEMVWGFPQYQKKGLVINARAESALERRMFRESVLHRRCIIPARKFYEWDSDRNQVTFYREGQSVLYMAGFYSCFEGQDRFVILTTEANRSVSPVHSRMPLILEKTELHDWIYEDGFTEFALHKTPPLLGRWQEYEQQNLFEWRSMGP